VSNELLREFTYARHCELCLMPTPGGAHPHHVHSRGAGRLDIKINLISLCPDCHRRFHDGHIDRKTLLEIVALREKTTVEAIEDEIYRLRRAAK